ncbi:EAL domain-containing protein [Pseudomonas sp. Xaverov 259]|uniref:EAL domain-containing protein n=1 Tax=Pseudomonas sp. Xaverov 259 TaxID=2666086 RepID=UPI001C5B5E98
MKPQPVCSLLEFLNLHVMVLESDDTHATDLSARFLALGMKDVIVVSSLREMSTQLSQTPVDVLVTDIRADSNDGLMLPCFLKTLFGAAISLQSPRLLWMAQEAESAGHVLFQSESSPKGRAGICKKALDAHAKLARAEGFIVATLYSKSMASLSSTLLALLATARKTDRPVPATTDVPTEDDVIAALATGEGLRVVFQPQYDLRSMKVVGAEALIRWRHPEHGDISPAVLIPLVNKLGLHLLLFSFVNAKVLEMLLTLKGRQLNVPISVNASVDTLCTLGFADRLAERMTRARIPSHLLKIELTEDIPVMDELTLSAALNALKARGFGVSLDDFGSGSATLRQIARMPFDEVKIDGALIRDLDSKSPARRIVASTLALARRLNMTVVAEGIETESCRVLLRRLGCQNGQGYVLSRPMEADELLARLDRNTAGEHTLQSA